MTDSITKTCIECDKDFDWIPDGHDPVCEDCNEYCACGGDKIINGFCIDCI